MFMPYANLAVFHTITLSSLITVSLEIAQSWINLYEYS